MITLMLWAVVLCADTLTEFVRGDPTQCALQRNGEASCTNCLVTQQCKDAYNDSFYCCPFMKKCIQSGGSCAAPTARCSPRCYATTWSEVQQCTCPGNSDFPNRWVTGCHTDGTTASQDELQDPSQDELQDPSQ